MVGDRYSDVSVLAGRTWDAVVDVSAYTPGAVERTAEILQDATQHYTFVSTVSVYRNFARPGADENAPVSTLADENIPSAELNYAATGTVNGKLYGPLKAKCEGVVASFFPDALVVRPGVVVGPCDYTDRLTYWVQRIGLAGRKLEVKVLAPGNPEPRVQFIDARDLTAWLLQSAVNRLSGTFNATGPDYSLTFGAFLDTCRHTLNPDAELVWVNNSFLLERGLEPGELMPWHPVERMPGWEGFYNIDLSKALQHGLTFRPLDETVKDIFSWSQTRKRDEPLKAGLTKAREAVLLRAWSAENR